MAIDPISLGTILKVGAAILPSLMGGSGDHRTGFEKNIAGKLQGIIGQGGVGFTQPQLKQRAGYLREEAKPAWNQVRSKTDANLAGRGIWNSGLAYTKHRDIDVAQAKSFEKLMSDLEMWNEERKQNTLMQALGLGAGVASSQGGMKRFGQAQDQNAFMGMYGNLLGMLDEKGFFDF